jgi:hypothetical protein
VLVSTERSSMLDDVAGPNATVSFVTRPLCSGCPTCSKDGIDRWCCPCVAYCMSTYLEGA